MSMKLTPFGQFTRKLRVDRGEYMKDMSAHLGVTPSFLSAVESGKRNPPLEWADTLGQAYNLSDDDIREVHALLNQSRTYERVDVAHLSAEDRQIIERLAVSLPTLDEASRQNITNVTTHD